MTSAGFINYFAPRVLQLLFPDICEAKLLDQLLWLMRPYYHTVEYSTIFNIPFKVLP